MEKETNKEGGREYYATVQLKHAYLGAKSVNLVLSKPEALKLIQALAKAVADDSIKVIDLAHFTERKTPSMTVTAMPKRVKPVA
jgi:hypothetical protein